MFYSDKPVVCRCKVSIKQWSLHVDKCHFFEELPFLRKLNRSRKTQSNIN